jgi:hypothetical protein
VDLALKGLASQLAQENDLLLVDGVRNNLFGPPGAGGLDLAALDIQRGRDHGLPDFNTLRKLYGLERVTSFVQISSDPQIQARLEQLFGTVSNIDAFVGALAEDHLPGSSVGPLIQAVVANQFQRLRDGDRFFYASDEFFRSDELRRIVNLERVSLAQVIRWNTNINHIQKNVFFDDTVLLSASSEFGAGLTSLAVGVLTSLIETETGQGPDVFRISDAAESNLVESISTGDAIQSLDAREQAVALGFPSSYNSRNVDGGNLTLEGEEDVLFDPTLGVLMTILFSPTPRDD